jgi:hypothetical protein
MAGDYSGEGGKGEILSDRRPPTVDRRFLTGVTQFKIFAANYTNLH